VVEAIPIDFVADVDVPAVETLICVVDWVVGTTLVDVGLDVNSNAVVPRSKLDDPPIFAVLVVNGAKVLDAAASVGVKSTPITYTEESQAQAVRSGSSTIVKATQ
jgi:hypothetical protein